MTNKELINIIKQYPLGEYGLKVHTEIDNQLQIIEMIDFSDNEIILWSNDNFCHESGDRIVLRPLSLLTEEIEHNGEKFVPIEILSNWTTCDYCEDSFYYTNELGEMSEIELQQLEYFQFIKLLEWKFDVFGLIDKGYAISTESINNIKIY